MDPGLREFARKLQTASIKGGSFDSDAAAAAMPIWHERRNLAAERVATQQPSVAQGWQGGRMPAGGRHLEDAEALVFAGGEQQLAAGVEVHSRDGRPAPLYLVAVCQRRHLRRMPPPVAAQRRRRSAERCHAAGHRAVSGVEGVIAWGSNLARARQPWTSSAMWHDSPKPSVSTKSGSSGTSGCPKGRVPTASPAL